MSAPEDRSQDSCDPANSWSHASLAGIPPDEDPALEPAPASVPLPRASERFGPFEVRGQLGRGGAGAVYDAYDPASRRRVALKVPLGVLGVERRERFLREGVLAAALDHPGIVRVHTAGDVEGVPYIAYELVEGQDLSVARSGLDRGRRLRVVLEVAAALAHAHTQGVVHRDIKPENILVDAEGRVRVADFGLALARGLTRLTQSGAMLGTPMYMAPEQLVGARDKVSPATDVWALGGLLYELLTDRPPFPGPTLQALLGQILECDPDPPRQLDPSIPPAVESVCLRALSSDPRSRPADAAAFAAQLRSALSGQDPRGSRRLGGLAVAVASLTLLLIVLGGLGRGPSVDPTRAEPEGPVAELPAVRPGALDAADAALRAGDGAAALEALAGEGPADEEAWGRRRALARLLQGEELEPSSLPRPADRRWARLEARRQELERSLERASPEFWTELELRLQAALDLVLSLQALEDHPLVGSALRQRLGATCLEVLLDARHDAPRSLDVKVDALAQGAESLLPGDPRPAWALGLRWACRAQRARNRGEPLGEPPSLPGREEVEGHGPRWQGVVWSWRALASGPRARLTLDAEPAGSAGPARYNEEFGRSRGRRFVAYAFHAALVAALSGAPEPPERLRFLWTRCQAHLLKGLEAASSETLGPGLFQRCLVARNLLFAGRPADARAQLQWTGGSQPDASALIRAECALLEGDLDAAEQAHRSMRRPPRPGSLEVTADCWGQAAVLAARRGRGADVEEALERAARSGVEPFLPWLAPAAVRRSLASGRDWRQPLWDALARD